MLAYERAGSRTNVACFESFFAEASLPERGRRYGMAVQMDCDHDSRVVPATCSRSPLKWDGSGSTPRIDWLGKTKRQQTSHRPEKGNEAIEPKRQVYYKPFLCVQWRNKQSFYIVKTNNITLTSLQSHCAMMSSIIVMLMQWLVL